MEKAKLDLKILEPCKIYHVIPKVLRFKLHRKCLNSATFYRAWQTKLLVNEINLKKKTIKKFEAVLETQKASVMNNMSPWDRRLLANFTDREIGNVISRCTLTHQKKVRALGIKQDINPCDPESIIFNFSDREIPNRVKYLLAFGLDFGLPIFKLDYVKYFFGFEKLAYSLRNVPGTVNYNDFCNKLKFISHKYFYNFKSSKVFSIFSNVDLRLLKDFSKNDDIIISKPDKGRGIVIVNKTHYIHGMSLIINNNSKFEIISQYIE